MHLPCMKTCLRRPAEVQSQHQNEDQKTGLISRIYRETGNIQEPQEEPFSAGILSWCHRPEQLQTTETQITTCWNQGLQKSSRSPHRVFILSAKNRKLKLQFTQSPQNCTTEDWKNVSWSNNQPTANVLCCHFNLAPNLWGMFSLPCWISAIKSYCSSEAKSTNKMDLMMCPVSVHLGKNKHCNHQTDSRKSWKLWRLDMFCM